MDNQQDERILFIKNSITKGNLLQSIQNLLCAPVVQAFLMYDDMVEFAINTFAHLRRKLSLNLFIAKSSGNRPARATSHLSGIHAVCSGLNRSRAYTQFIHFFTVWLSPAFHEFPTIQFNYKAH